MKFQIQFTILFLILILATNVLSQEEDPPDGYEILIGNHSTSRTITIKVYPVSMLFNNRGFYDLHTRYPDEQYPYKFHFMTGACDNAGTVGYQWNIAPGENVNYQHENAVQQSGTGSRGVLGHGVYKIEFYWGSQLKDTCLFEYDAKRPPYDIMNDLSFDCYDDESNLYVYYNWTNIDNCGARNISAAGRYLKEWEPDWCNNPPIYNRSKQYGDFIYTVDENNTYEILPQDFRNDCDNENYSDIT